MDEIEHKSVSSRLLDRTWNNQLFHLRSTEIGGLESTREVIIDAENRQVKFHSSMHEKIQKSGLLYTQARVKERNLQRLKTKIKRTEKKSFVKEKYFKKIDAEIAFIKVIKAKTSQRTSTEEKNELIHTALASVYPIPSDTEMQRFILEFLSFISYLKENHELNIDSFGDLELLLKPEFYGVTGEIPTLSFANEIEKFKSILLMEADDKPLTAVTVKRICKRVVSHYGIEKSVKVRIKNKAFFSVHPAKAMLTVPRSISITKTRLKQIIFHEIGVHLYRAVLGRKNLNRKNQRLRLLQSGSQTNLALEEGIATYFEQNSFYDSSKYDIPSTYNFYLRMIAVQLALVFEPYEVFEKLTRLEALCGVLFNVSESKQRKNVLHLIMRVYRGFMQPQKGCVNAKVAQYLVGNRMIWNFIENGGNIHNLFAGKIIIEDIELLRGMGFTIPEEYLGSKGFPREKISQIIEKSI
jgi:hypothetical protein